jgi:amidase
MHRLAGSSSGSAVAVSANVVPLAFGTETDTSIIGPAITCGVVAVKPTVGLTSRGGVIPISETQDSIGPFGRTVSDAARALDVIAGPDPEDSHSTVPERKQPRSYCDYLADRHALKGAHFGLPNKRFWDLAPKPQRDVAERVIQWLKEAGASIHSVELPCAEDRIHEDGHWDWERYGDTDPSVSEITVSKVETYYLMREYLSRLKNTSMHSLEDIVRFNDENRGSEGGHAGDLPAFADGQDLFRKCVATKGVKDETYYAALRHIQTQCRKNGIDAALKHPDDPDVTLDALLFCDIKMAGQCIAAQAGYPIISVPIGVDPDGMPVSLTIQHTAWEEAKLVKWASAIEGLVKERQGSRVTPSYKEHLRKNIPVYYPWSYKGSPKYDSDRV